MKGQELLTDINAVRACLGLAPVARMRMAEAFPDHPQQCAVALATGTEVVASTRPPWPDRFVLRFDGVATAEAVGAAIGRPVAPDRPEVLLPDAAESLVSAYHFGLVFTTPDGYLKGWVEPSVADPRAWDLHLMPGEGYPPRHEPAGAETVELVPLSA